eukprot:c6472_g2_i1 orf=203-391(-)
MHERKGVPHISHTFRAPSAFFSLKSNSTFPSLFSSISFHDMSADLARQGTSNLQPPTTVFCI